jgi:two-component SAPR family response regulator
MNKLNVLIIDDEPMAQTILEIYCQKIQTIHVVALCKNAMEAMPYLQSEKIDLLFIDINMPEITGIDFVKSVKEPVNIIFTTAYSEYAVESYSLNALDYLLKPISFERFVAAVNKAFKAKSEENTQVEDSKE